MHTILLRRQELQNPARNVSKREYAGLIGSGVKEVCYSVLPPRHSPEHLASGAWPPCGAGFDSVHAGMMCMYVFYFSIMASYFIVCAHDAHRVLPHAAPSGQIVWLARHAPGTRTTHTPPSSETNT